MTTEVTLTTSWQKIADGGNANCVSFETDDAVRVATGSSTPTVSGHLLTDGGSFAYTGSSNIYAKLDNADATGTAHVESDAYGGLTGFSAVLSISVFGGR